MGVVANGRTGGGERLEISHAPEAEHDALLSSDQQMRVLGALVLAVVRSLSFLSAGFLRRSPQVRCRQVTSSPFRPCRFTGFPTQSSLR